MAMIDRAGAIALAFSALVAAATPLLSLSPGKRPPPVSRAAAAAPLVPRAAAPLAAVYTRALFDGEAQADAPPPADAPRLLGVLGRIGRDAVAFVADGSGAARSLSPGERIDGWRLESLSADAAFFTRGSERVRVALPAAQ